LLDDLRERICWAHYQIPLHKLIRELYMPAPTAGNSDTDTTAPPF